MNYTGFPWLASVGLATETSAYIDEVSLCFGRGNLTIEIESGVSNPRSKITLGNINYKHVRRIHATGSENSHFFLGGVFSSSIGLYKRSIFNEEFYYCYQSSVGPAFVFRRNLTDNGLWQVSTQVDAALLSYVISPAYGSYMPEELIRKELSDITAWDFVCGGKVLAVNKFQRINCLTNLTFDLHKKISLRISYGWEFYHLEQPAELTLVGHRAFISLIIN